MFFLSSNFFNSKKLFSIKLETLSIPEFMPGNKKNFCQPKF